MAFADFAQHPAYGLVHKMVRMSEEAVGQAEREVEASGAYHSPGGDYRHIKNKNLLSKNIKID